MLFGILFVFALLIGRLAYIQIIWAPELIAKASSHWIKNINIQPKRGDIYDRNGVVLAQSAPSSSIVAYPNLIKDPDNTANCLASVLGENRDELFEKLKDSEKSFTWIKRHVSNEEAEEVKALELAGIGIIDEQKRFYPNNELAAHVIGFTAKYAEEDGLKGQEGIELAYDSYLKGVPGKITRVADANGRKLAFGEENIIPVSDGLDVVLTIDQVIQYFTEEAIKSVVEEYTPQKVYAIVMDPHTGEILAMAGYPSFDPNSPPREQGLEEMQSIVKNTLAKDTIVPGSVFKIITGAAGLEEGIVDINTTFDDPGYRIVDGVKIRCHEKEGHGLVTLAQGFQHSCNPVFMDIALGLGKAKLYEYIYKFGFGQKTGIDIDGEESGILLHQEVVKNVDLARIGFGQAIATTPIQIVNAVSAAVNGGRLMQPHLLKEVREPYFDEMTKEEHFKVIKTIEPKMIRQVISPQTSAILREILQRVVDDGSGSNAKIPGYLVGGKTGTSQKYDGNKVKEKAYVASYVGIAPINDPKLVVYFAVDEPVADVVYGSTIAAPYAKEILENSLKHLNIVPTEDIEGIEIEDEANKESDG